MKVSINNKETFNKTLYYEENLWTGKRTILYYGTPLKKLSYNKYLYERNGLKETFEVNGNSLVGVKIKMFDRQIKVIRPLNWYEILLSVLVFVSFFVFSGFSNSVWLGALLGGIGGSICVTNLFLVKLSNNIWQKILLSIVMIGLGLLLSYIFTFHFFKAPPIV